MAAGSRLDVLAPDIARALSFATRELGSKAGLLAARWAIDRAGLTPARLSQLSTDQVAAMVADLDDRYFQASESREAGQPITAEAVVAAFSQARAASAFEFVLRGEPAEAIYEAANSVDDWSDLRALVLASLNSSNNVERTAPAGQPRD